MSDQVRPVFAQTYNDGVEITRYVDDERHVIFNRADGQLGLDLILPVYTKP